MDYREKYQQWLNHPNLVEEVKKQLREMTDQQIKDAFYTDVAFGTAGMRGLMGYGPNRLNIYTIRKATQGFANYLNHNNKHSVAIAYDNRYNSKDFAFDCAKLLASNGIEVYIFDSLRPTPELSYTVRYFKCDGGIMITASHNPKEYNGYKLYDETGCQLKQLPGMYQLVSGQVTVSQMKDVSVEDLLGREPIRADMEEVYSFINGKTVMVTGGGGSIGSELCRQIAAHHPKQLIIFEIYENNAYDIQLELKRKHPELDLVVLIGSVRDSRRVFQVFKQYRPQIVYHAAAHKHVPLMEDSPCESIKNNALGTYKTAYAAMVNGCDRFVLISTDKAVNPTNIMGASKRLCEMIIQSFDKKIKEKRVQDIPQLFTHVGYENADKDGTGEVWKHVHTEFVAVRFGNVLGSNGSVIPLFRKQIAEGGPVTVTHPDIIRYFMTIPEAVSLVMLAGTYAKGGEIFVLDMGSPVKIESLARNLIRQSGFKPDVDIKIVYTGLRPGEKLYEEKLMAEEGLQKTDNELIHIGRPIAFDEDQFLKKLGLLMDAAYENRRDIRGLVAGMVNTYHPADVEPIPLEGETEKRKVTEPDQ